jgi:sporulation protein YlmC with PRC-barrel domain
VAIAKVLGIALAVGTVACTQATPPSGAGDAAPPMAGPALAASQLPGAQVLGAGGEPLGRVEQVLLDVQPLGQHYILLQVADGRSFPYPVNALRMDGGSARLEVPQHLLQGLPGYRDGDWPAVAVPGRFVHGGALIGKPVVDAIGNPVGQMREVVIDADTARTRYYRIEFQGREVLPMPAHEMRLSPDGPPVLQASRLRRG